MDFSKLTSLAEFAKVLQDFDRTGQAPGGLAETMLLMQYKDSMETNTLMRRYFLEQMLSKKAGP